MTKALDLTGRRFGDLRVLFRVANGAGEKTRWRCLCDCGEETTAAGSNLVRGLTQSCGCRGLSSRRLRYVSKDPRTGCWNWTGSFQSGGYGEISVRGRKLRAHRYFWEDANGPIPAGLIVCHRCDNPKCVNPEHLFLGTHRDNCEDKVSKGRASAGKLERHGHAKLTVASVEEMRAQKEAEGTSYRDLGRAFGVSETVARKAVLGITWRAPC